MPLLSSLNPRSLQISSIKCITLAGARNNDKKYKCKLLSTALISESMPPIDKSLDFQEDNLFRFLSTKRKLAIVYRQFYKLCYCVSTFLSIKYFTTGSMGNIDPKSITGLMRPFSKDHISCNVKLFHANWENEIKPGTISQDPFLSQPYRDDCVRRIGAWGLSQTCWLSSLNREFLLRILKLCH